MARRQLSPVSGKERFISLTVILVVSVGLLLVGTLMLANERTAASPITRFPAVMSSEQQDGNRNQDAPQTADAFIFFQPGTGGNCAAPPNGGSVAVGCRFVLDLLVNAGSNNGDNPDGGVICQVDFLAFTSSLIQNARVSSINTACTPTNTLTIDMSYMEVLLENKVCNGPNPCILGSSTYDPGTVSFTSGTFGQTCPNGCPDGGTPDNPFRVARMGICAIAPGTAILHWQFNPPDPPARDTEIIISNGSLVQSRVLFTDYTFCVGASCTPPPPTDTPTITAIPTNTPIPPTNTFIPSNTRTPTYTRTVTPTHVPLHPDAFMLFQPGTGGNCSAPPNGGSVAVGCRFVLNLMVNAGSNNGDLPDGGVFAHQSYLTFTNDLVMNTRVSAINSGCTLTNTLTMDTTYFENLLKNEACNGPNPCQFGGPGTISFASGTAGAVCPYGCPDDATPDNPFRVARMGLCAVAPGTVVFHWQFNPPDPSTRNTQMILANGDLVQQRTLFTDYTFNVAAPPTNTPTATPTPAPILAGHVTWQGRPAQPNTLQQLPVTLTLKMGSIEFDYPAQTTDAYGSFSVALAGVPNGTYTWRVKEPKYLANMGIVTLTGAAQTNAEMGLMRVGDANNDNAVNISDFNILKAAFGTAMGDPQYDDRTDLNGDQLISITDTNLNKMNFGQAGAPPP